MYSGSLPPHKVVYFESKRKVTAYPWGITGTSGGSPVETLRARMGLLKNPTLDLEFFSWNGAEAMEYEKAEQARKKKYASCLQLVKHISGLPTISDDNLQNSDWKCENVEQVLLENGLLTKENAVSTVVQSAFVDDKFVDQFIDFMIDEWKEPTISELIYTLILFKSNTLLNNLLKRRHMMKMCYFVLTCGTNHDAIETVFKQFLEKYHSISINVLCSILHDELRRFKDFKRNNYDFALESKCMELILGLRVKYSSESADSAFQSILVYILRVGNQHVSKNLCTKAVLALKEMKAKSKLSFGAVKKAFETKSVTTKIAGTLAEYCQATNTERYMEAKMEEKKELGEKAIGTGTDVEDFVQDIDVDPSIYSIDEMNKHLDATILKNITPYIHSQFIKKHYGSLHHQEVEEEKEFQYLAKAIIRLRNYGTRKMALLSNKMMYDNIDTSDLKDFSTQTFKRNQSAEYFNYLVQDLAPIMEYLNREKMSLGYDAMYILGVCCEYKGMIVEKFSHNSWSIKPIYTYLIDSGIFQRLEEIISKHLKGPPREHEDDRIVRLQYICEAIRLGSELFNSMKINGEISRVSFILETSKFFEYLIYCLYEFREEEIMLKTIEPCFEYAAACRQEVGTCLIYKKYLLAQINQMFDYAILLPETTNNDKVDLTTAMTVIIRTLYDIATPTVSKVNGSLLKNQRRLLAPMLGCGIFSKLASFLKQKQGMLTGFAISAMNEDRDPQYHWIAELVTIMSYYSRYPPMRKCFYENNYEIFTILLSKVIFALNDVFRKKSSNQHRKLHFPNVSGSSFLNGLSLVNRLLWDRETRKFMSANEKNRSSVSGSTKLEDLCFYWINYFVQRVKNSDILTQSDLLVWGRSYFLLSSLMIEEDFRTYLATNTQIVELLMDTISIKARRLTTDVKNSSCKCIMILLKEPKAAEKIQVDKILKFINSELKNETTTRLIAPENEIESNVLLGVLFDIFESPIGDEAKQLIKAKYPLLAPQIKEIEKCNSCGKSSSESSLKRCSACNSVRYCSVECQKKDWKNHKEKCKKIQEESKQTIVTALQKVYSAEKLKTKGNNAFKENDFKRAINYYARALIQEDAKDIKHILNLNIAQSYFMIHDYEQSLKYAELALEIDPSYIKAIHRKAICLKMLSRNSEALAVANKGLLLSPGEKQLQDLVASLK